MPCAKRQPDFGPATGDQPVSGVGADNPPVTPTPVPAAPTEADGGPLEMIGAKPNIERLRWEFREVTRVAMEVARGVRPGIGINFAQITDMLREKARTIYGIDPKRLMDVRTPDEQIAEALEKLADAHEDILAEKHDLLVLIRDRMDKADDLCARELAAPGTDEGKWAELAADGAEKKRRWFALIHLAVQIQTRARDPEPVGTPPSRKHAVRAAHTLRFMLCISRSGMTSDKKTEKGRNNPDDVYDIGQHHAVMAVWHYLAWNDLDLKGTRVAPVRRWEGEIQIMPTGHGKTAFFAHVVLVDIAENPKTKWHIYHASEKMANFTLQFIGTCLDENEATGKRMVAIHPHIRLLQNTSNRIRVDTGEPQRAPTVASFGMTSRTSGTDALRIWMDDAVDQDAIDQPTDREYVFSRMNGTIKRRLRGQDTKLIVTATLYHHQDANSRMLEMVKNKQLRMVRCVQNTGGPNSPKPFAALWPEVYPTSAIKAIYTSMRNPRLFAAMFEANPLPESSTKVKALAYFLAVTSDGQPDAQHKAFLEDPSTTFWVSVDPTASEEEDADKAAFIYGAIGDVVDIRDNVRTFRRRLRVLEYREFHANQIQLTSELRAFCEHRPVHHVLFEARSGFRAAADFWEHEMGLDAERIDPSNRPKGLRLGDVAPMLDASLTSKGLPPPVVEFLGQEDKETGQLWPHEDLKPLTEQILRFGAHPEDHGVDATTQLCKRLGPDLSIGEADITRRAQQMGRVGDERLMRMFDQWENKSDTPRNPAQDMWDYSKRALECAR